MADVVVAADAGESGEHRAFGRIRRTGGQQHDRTDHDRGLDSADGAVLKASHHTVLEVAE
jgi:hypothetical protein